ncbi:uncharacterized protein Z518_02640 [Rhinocladiella mackenziei CBS 650.93]|uniref:ATP-dependent DNA helicase n=1 Tax=Rhinocladiella mackenziei CBS 650.93 TaxID=1442369 RepID=A0A0D2IXD6_9EURO|nr:uncharacterized protein Z518_02640 [Rhinocladiella mackenziei CBS 650.93]KIX07986.1 hypothetical protein Z518_02640 [Rhinocladiella mackenziei CBS 650.93]
MSTPSESGTGYTGTGSQAAQVNPVTPEKEPIVLSNSEMWELYQWLTKNHPKEWKEELQHTSITELCRWLEKKNPKEYEKLLPSLAKKAMTKTDINNPAFHVLTSPQKRAIFHALQKDWNNAYFPHSLVALRDLIRRYQLLDVSKYYAKTLVFVQSSGTGKSRLADAFGQLCPMINFILREPGTSGFPPPDKEILSFLREKRPDNIPEPASLQGTSGDSLERRAIVAWNHTLAAALLQASFEIFNIWVESKPFSEMTLEKLAGDRHAEMAPLALATDANDTQNQRSKMRIEFCESVAKRARAIANDLIFSPAWVEKFDDDRSSSIRRQFEMAWTEPLDPLTGLLNAAENLIKNIQQCRNVSDTNSLLVIVFDEASSLIEKGFSGEPRTGLYVALNRVISCLKKFRMWSFFLSTESLIGHLVPPNNIIRTGDYSRDRSARVSFTQPAELMRFPPFVSLQLDIEDRRRMQNPILRKEELVKSLKRFADLEHMALFGRPLWYAYICQKQNMIDVAKLKLLGGQQRSEYNDLDPNHVFAALSFRLSLDVCRQNPATLSFTREAVNSFMRVVISMDHETGMMDTTTPSEPVLAKAAMEHLCIEGRWSLSISTLCMVLLEKGLIEKGRKGELYARLVLILAHDWVRWAREPVFPPTFTVCDFLMALYAKDHHGSIREIPKRTLEARMNFTHFLSTDTQLTPEDIPALCRDLLRRSAAMQLCWNQETYDILIPVYYGTEDETFDPSNCGVIVVQVKNKENATTPREIFEEEFINDSPKTSNSGKSKEKSSDRKPMKFVFTQMANPILFLLFDLGVVRSSAAYAPLVQVMHSANGKQPDLWAIHSRGHGHTIFGCLEHFKATDSSERFFAAIQTGNTLADRLSQRNRVFSEINENFRYESEARMQEVEAELTGSKRKERTGLVRTGGLPSPSPDSGSAFVAGSRQPRLPAEEVQDDLIVLESGDISARRSVLRRYRDRLTDTRNGNAALRDLSLLSCLQFWDWLKWKIRPRASSRVINYYPRYPNDPKSQSYSDHCRVKLMLHHPFTDWSDLLSVENESYGSYIDAFRACRRLHTHPPDFYDDPEGEGSDSDSSSDDEDPPEEAANEHPLADFEVLARRRPGADLPTRGDLLDGLGSREIDRAYDWSTHIGRYGDLRPDVWEQIKAENPIELVVDVNSSPEPLNREQRKLYDMIVTHYTNEISLTRHSAPPQLLLNVDGEAGTGKTFTLLKACARIQEIATAAGKGNPVFRAAPTGIAAFNIVGKTLHSLLRLPVKMTTSDLSVATLQLLQASFASCRFLIIDEKSMIDLKTLCPMHRYLLDISRMSLSAFLIGYTVVYFMSHESYGTGHRDQHRLHTVHRLDPMEDIVWHRTP